jgi:hypothetical protein
MQADQGKSALYFQLKKKTNVDGGSIEAVSEVLKQVVSIK